jgi:hypothetical protein
VAITTLRQAATFIRRVELALLFPARGVDLPSLWEEVAGPGRRMAEDGWGQDEDRVWAWKDELPRRGLAWYGPFARGRKSFVSPALLAELYPGAGRLDDHRRLDLSADAHRIADVLEAGGATPQSAVRIATGLDGKSGKTRFDKAMTELGRNLLVTRCGIYEGDSGWPAAVLELTPRVFEVGPSPDPAAALARLRRALPGAAPGELARALGWPVARVRALLT